MDLFLSSLGQKSSPLEEGGSIMLCFLLHAFLLFSASLSLFLHVSPFPPSDKIGINSIQREVEEIVPMKQMKMHWIPYTPLENRESQVERLKFQIYILSCTQRRAALKQLETDHVKKYDYCNTYVYNPFKEDMLEQSTKVEFIDEVIQGKELSEDQQDAFKQFVEENVREAKKANRETRETMKKALQEMSEETKQAFESMRFYKFYLVQTPDTLEISGIKVLWARS